MSANLGTSTEDRLRRAPAGWLVAAGLAVYPILRFGIPAVGPGLLVNVFPVAAAYFLAIYLYYGVPGLVYRKVFLPLAVGLVPAVIISLLAVSRHFVGQSLLELAMLFVAGTVTGVMTRMRRHPTVTYTISALLVAALAVAFFLPQWPKIMAQMSQLFDQVIAEWKQTWTAGGATAEEVEEYGLKLAKLAPVIVRLLPAVTIMSVIIQFSLGFLLFFRRTVEDSPERTSTLRLTRWRVPFEAMPVVIVLVIMRLFAGRTPELIADNGIFVLSIYYCLGGLSLVEFYLNRIHLTLPFKIVFYVFLGLTGFVGFLVTAIAGFIDSFADWRARSSPKLI